MLNLEKNVEEYYEGLLELKDIILEADSVVSEISSIAAAAA